MNNISATLGDALAFAVPELTVGAVNCLVEGSTSD
jgi:hypothetical protein